MTVPDPLARGQLKVSGKTIDLLPLWPNLVRTSTCDVTGPLIDGGDGSLEALSGKTVAGSIVVLDFDSGTRWSNAGMLGAKAVIFRSAANMSRAEAEGKFRTIPLDVPRFLLDSKTSEIPFGETARLSCRQEWVQSKSANLTARLPGSNPKLADETIVLWAYADAMSIAPGAAPGSEQATGLAALLELAELLAKTPHARPIEMVVSGAHGLALQGAREYIDRRIESRGAQPFLVVTLDLSTGAKGLGIFGRGYHYNYRDEIPNSVQPLGRAMRRRAEKITPLLGETIPRVVLTDAINHSDNRTWRNNIPARFAFDCEAFMTAGYNAVTFATIDDSRPFVDSPSDTPDRTNLDNLYRQVQILAVMVSHIVNDPIGSVGDDILPVQPPRPNRMSLIGGFATNQGYVAVYDPSKSLVPDLRVPESLAVHLTGRKTEMGVRGTDIQLTKGPNAEFRLIGLPPLTDYATKYKPPTIVMAFHVDKASGRIDYAPDFGPFGDEAFPVITHLTTSFRSSPVVVFPCVATSLYGLVDPQDLTPLMATTILDPVGGGKPRSFGVSVNYFDPTATASGPDDSAVLYLPRDQRFQILMGTMIGEQRLILTNSSPGNVSGEGYRATEEPFGDVTLPAARDLSAINQGRIDSFAKYRILGAGVLDLHAQAKAEIDAANKAMENRDWADARRHSRAAWGLALRLHPILKGTANDVVNGVIFYSFLLIPFSFFFERLVFASKSLTKQVGVSTAVFVAAFFILRFVHPAFEMVANPTMIFVGFVMGSLSVIVTSFILGKFELALRTGQQSKSGVRELDIRRSNVAMAAFSLGISNLRRRKARTLLTTLTLVVMTFIVLSFMSIVPDIQLKESSSDNVARFSGVLLRDPGLQPLQPSSYEALLNEFRGRGSIARRIYSYGADVQQGAAMSIRRGEKWADASAMLGLDSEEADLTKPQEALIAGRWFRPGETRAIILPKQIAEQLGIGVTALSGSEVRFMGVDLRVVGVYDSEKMKSVVDLDGESVMPPDTSLSDRAQKISATQAQAFRKFIRLDPAVCFILPSQTALEMRGDLKSVAVAMTDPAQTVGAMKALMPRLRLNLYASVPSGNGFEVRKFSVLQGTSSTGLALVIIQLGIAAIFVLNTMIATVYERTREISIFSAIGLAPNHISTLFFAESLVYGVLGVVLGYFAAQGVARGVVSSGAFPQLTLNFSSSSAVMSAFLVIGVVVASTIYPARKAAKIAAPAMAEEALASEPEGDDWSIPLPFSVSTAEAGPLVAFLADWLRAYEEYTIGSFVTSGTTVGEPAPGVFETRTMSWIAPYDLGVSQEVIIDARAGAAPNTYELTLRLRRISGEPRNWTKLNGRFLTALRRQFLAWRTLSEEERSQFLPPTEVATPAAV